MNYTDKDMTTTPWCYMPPEMHFDSPQDLRDAFFAFSLSRVQESQANKQLSNYLLPPVGKFEKVRSKCGKYILVPTTIDLSFVYRGQTKFYDECRPTLYRESKTEEEIFVERLRCCEFEEYLRQLPEVKAFEEQHFQIDYLGLSQHYGLQTDVIDLTNSLEVALFFAMCNMSKDGKSFFPQQEDKDYIGYIYVVKAFEMDGVPNGLKTLYDGELSVIGMQPFYRPGSQRGFGLHIEKDKTMTGLLYSFSYTKQDSENIYNFFNEGTTLWHEDDISRVAREIKDAKTFCYHAMNACFKRYFSGNKRARLALLADLKQQGYTFQKHSLWEMDKVALATKRAEYEQIGGASAMSNIVQRETMDKNGIRKHCIDTRTLTSLWMLQFPESGCPAPADYDSPFEYQMSKDNKVWGFSLRNYTQFEQTKPNPVTKKVEKWVGDWRTLKIDYHREKKLKLETVRMPRK